MKQNSSKFPASCLFILLVFLTFAIPSHADLGLSSSDFGSAPVSGAQIGTAKGKNDRGTSQTQTTTTKGGLGSDLYP